MRAVIAQDWHGVKAGTPVNVIRSFVCDWSNRPRCEIESVDGTLMPTADGFPSTRTVISADFVSQVAA